ncbi:ankyrin [Cenococcum geophilum 1.58]|uniref:ankyrin n=1 Tax=Cenococcum geophilum 1.58 TaxID=794803 RepID=UPI00358E0639|nr:ankyrin [Cenococcum geophilum 1.58]
MHLEAVRFLLQNGADPNIPDDDQILPVFAVVGMNPRRSQHFEQLPPTWDYWLDTLRLLIRYGASTNEIVRGRSLAGLNIARHDESSEVLPFLRLLAVEDSIDHNSTADDPSWPVVKNAVKSGTDAVDALKLLQACGVSITRVLADGRTVLHLAAHHCQDDETLSYLLATGCAADINRQDQWGWTPLHYAVLARTSADGPRPYSKAIMLIRNGADPSIKGRMNPGSSYQYYSEEFTGLELLEYVRYTRFELFMNVLNSSGIEIGSSANTDAFYDAEEYHSGRG